MLLGRRRYRGTFVGERIRASGSGKELATIVRENRCTFERLFAGRLSRRGFHLVWHHVRNYYLCLCCWTKRLPFASMRRWARYKLPTRS